MRKPIPLTGTVTDVGVVSPEHARFLSSLNRAMEKTFASGKIKIRPHGERQAAPMPTESTADGRPVDGTFVRRDRGSTGPISEQAAAAIQGYAGPAKPDF